MNPTVHLEAHASGFKKHDLQPLVPVRVQAPVLCTPAVPETDVCQPGKPLHETSDEEWDSLFNINLKSILHTTRHGIHALRKSKGCILNTSSLVGVIGQEIHAAYTATKGGMNTLTKSTALDYAKDGIRVNALCPAGTWTPMLRQWASEQPDPSGVSKCLDDIHPRHP